jgi:hypothetical protein
VSVALLVRLLECLLLGGGQDCRVKQDRVELRGRVNKAGRRPERRCRLTGPFSDDRPELSLFIRPLS